MPDSLRAILVCFILAAPPLARAQSATDAYVAKISAASVPSGVVISASTAGSIAGQSVAIPIVLANLGTVAPTSFQADLTFDPAVVTFVSAVADPQLTAVGLGLVTLVVSTSDVRLSASGGSGNAIANGNVAWATFRLSPEFSASTPIMLASCISAGAGTPLATGCQAGSIVAFTCAVTGDGTPGVADVQSLVNQALGLAAPLNDLNHDGAITVADVQKVIGAALNLGCAY